LYNKKNSEIEPKSHYYNKSDMRKILLLYIIFQVLLSSVNAQSNYPLYVIPTLTPPYSLNLSDYSKFGSQKLMITIHANDMNISNLPVKLKIKMETMGVTVENPPTIVTTPIYINGGETTILFGTDLEDYFNINNLIFKGYSKETYNRTGQLPEGFYKFTVEVLHFNTNRLISNQGTTNAWIALGKPPVLKLPANNAQLGQFIGMPLTFSWLSSNVGSPTSANTIQYKFEMWEMHVPSINPNTIAASTPVFHENTSFNTLYTLYPNALLMTPGMQYAWRVTASDLSGFVPFEQNGHSEIRTFTYKALCDSITDLSSSHRGRNGSFSWNPQNNHTSFNIEMRNPKTNWISNSQSYENKADFFDLDYGATYEMRVQAVCDGDPDSKSDFSEWKSLSIPTPEPVDTADCPNCVCDDDIPPVELQNFDLRNDLRVGDTIVNKTGTSRFILKTVEPQGNGTYKGIFFFWAEIWKLKFICNYWDLQVNTDDVVVNMDFESVYDPQFLVDVDATIDYLDSLAEIITTLTTDITPDDTLTITETITTIYVNEGDSVIVVTVDEDGNITETVLSDNVDNLEETLIVGADGEEYVVTSDGELMGIDEYVNTGGGQDSEIDDYNEEKENNNLSDDVTVNFTGNQNQKYGFDKYNDEKSSLQSTYPSLNNGYQPAYKSIASFSTDFVSVSNTGENIIFKDELGIPAIKAGEDISLRGSSSGSDVAMYAYQVINDSTEKIAGKLNILSFDEQAKKLYIVSVNGAATPDETSLQETLNNVYKQAVTSWTVTKLDDLKDITFENGNMTHGGSSAISVYNIDQRTIVNTFEDRVGKLESNAYYLFFVENVTFKERSIAGYMPLQRQVGFIYGIPSANTIAHELGHGAFNLYHTFSPEGFIAAEHSTENLMDYKGGIDLWKHQWQLVQSPDKMLFAWLQDESEGEARTSVKFQRQSSNDNFYDEDGNPAKSSNGHHISIPLNKKREFLVHNLDTTNNIIRFSNAKVSLDTIPVLINPANGVWKVRIKGDVAGDCDLIVENKSNNSVQGRLHTHIYNLTNIHNGNIYLLNIAGAFNINDINTRANYLFSPLAVDVNIATLNNAGVGINYDVNNSNYLEVYPGIDINSADNTELNVIRNITGVNFTWKDLVVVDKNIQAAWKVRENVQNGNKFIVVEKESGIKAGITYNIKTPTGGNLESFTVTGFDSNAKLEYAIASGNMVPPSNPDKLIYDITKLDTAVSSSSNIIRLKGDKLMFFNNQTLQRVFPGKQINVEIIKYEIVDPTNGNREELTLCQNPIRINDTIFNINTTHPLTNSYPKDAKIVVSYLAFSHVDQANNLIFVRGSKYAAVNTSLSGKSVKFAESDTKRFTLATYTMKDDGFIVETSTTFNFHSNNEIIVKNMPANSFTAGYSPDHSANRPIISSFASLSIGGITLDNNSISFLYTHENAHGFELKDVGLNGNVMKYQLDGITANSSDVNSFLFKSTEIVETSTGTPLGIYQNQWNDFKR